MYMRMVVVTGSRKIPRPISIGCWLIVNMIVTMLVVVMPKMCRVVFQCIANAHRCRVSSIQ